MSEPAVIVLALRDTTLASVIVAALALVALAVIIWYWLRREQAIKRFRK